MSKLVKELVTDQVKNELQGVEDAFVINLAGLTAVKNQELRAALRAKNIKLRVVKNSLARKAFAGTSLAPAFDGLDGSAAIIWGGTDVVDLAKEITKYTDDKKWAPLTAKGGAVGGEKLSGEQVKEVSKWPSRTELLSKISGQISGVGATLSAQLIGISGTLAGQVKEFIKKQEGDAPAPAEGETPAAG